MFERVCEFDPDGKYFFNDGTEDIQGNPLVDAIRADARKYIREALQGKFPPHTIALMVLQHTLMVLRLATQYRQAHLTQMLQNRGQAILAAVEQEFVPEELRGQMREYFIARNVLRNAVARVPAAQGWRVCDVFLGEVAQREHTILSERRPPPAVEVAWVFAYKGAKETSLARVTKFLADTAAYAATLE